MGGNKENMRQAMKELLGLVGLGPEEDEVKAQPKAAPVAEQSKRLETAEAAEERKRIEAEEARRAAEAQKAAELAKAEEAKRAAEAQKAAELAKAEEARRAAEAQKAAELAKAEEAKRAAELERLQAEAAKASVWDAPKAEPTDLEETQRKVAATVARGFFGFGRPKEKTEPAYEEPVTPAAPEPTFDIPDIVEPAPEVPTFEEEPIRPPFIRPGATVIAAGATFFGDIRAEGDVEVRGKLKGNLEATGNIRVAGKVLGDVKGDAVVLESGVIQGNITSTSYVTLDESSMVVGDVLATDIDDKGKVKGNLQIARAAVLSSTALLAGNVIAATIMMAQGAKVQGAIRTAEDPETNSLFGELEI